MQAAISEKTFLIIQPQTVYVLQTVRSAHNVKFWAQCLKNTSRGEGNRWQRTDRARGEDMVREERQPDQNLSSVYTGKMTVADFR